MGANKPAPRRLQLRAEDVRRLGGSVHFTPARFNIGEGGERSIVTSSGRFLVMWNWRKVVQNVLDVYQIHEARDTVVQDQFARASAQKVVVALPNDVILARKKKLQGTPTKRR